ncbi:hypothetical protein F4604DRAFT_1117480 [Suillus subluteus]|nr:hypothetical protein F4604DRAFT_1117480 [Suillus subluteus]
MTLSLQTCRNLAFCLSNLPIIEGLLTNYITITGVVLISREDEVPVWVNTYGVIYTTSGSNVLYIASTVIHQRRYGRISVQEPTAARPPPPVTTDLALYRRALSGFPPNKYSYHLHACWPVCHLLIVGHDSHQQRHRCQHQED